MSKVKKNAIEANNIQRKNMDVVTMKGQRSHYMPTTIEVGKPLFIAYIIAAYAGQPVRPASYHAAFGAAQHDQRVSK